MPCIARGLEKREAMLEKRKDVESHAWGDLKCDRAVERWSIDSIE
jgi:hypothetical protein